MLDSPGEKAEHQGENRRVEDIENPLKKIVEAVLLHDADVRCRIPGAGGSKKGADIRDQDCRRKSHSQERIENQAAEAFFFLLLRDKNMKIESVSEEDK